MSTKCRHSSGLGSDLPADRRKNGDPCGSSGAGNALPPVGGPDARANNVGRASRPSDAENGLKMGQTPGGSCLQLLWTPHSQPNFLYHATVPCKQRYLLVNAKNSLQLRQFPEATSGLHPRRNRPQPRVKSGYCRTEPRGLAYYKCVPL